MAHYDEYLAKFATDSEDEDDPVIRQLQFNALFREEDGFVVCLPDYEEPDIFIEPLPEPMERPVWVNPLETHDRTVNSMKEMSLKMKKISLQAARECRSNETSSTPQSRRRRNRRKRQAKASSEYTSAEASTSIEASTSAEASTSPKESTSTEASISVMRSIPSKQSKPQQQGTAKKKHKNKKKHALSCSIIPSSKEDNSMMNAVAITSCHECIVDVADVKEGVD